MINTDDIDDYEISGIDLRDYPDFCDAYLESVTLKDGRELTVGELDELQQTDWFYERVVQQAIEE